MKKRKDIAQPIKLRYILLFVVNGLMLLALLLLLTRYETWRTVTYVIPPGVGAGEATVVIPDEIVLRVGVKDTLVIENQDNVIHAFGPFVIGPESTFTQRFRRPLVYDAVCTFHEDQQLRLVVNSAPWSTVFWNRNAPPE
jgi:hypothetical protein